MAGFRRWKCPGMGRDTQRSPRPGSGRPPSGEDSGALRERRRVHAPGSQARMAAGPSKARVECAVARPPCPHPPALRPATPAPPLLTCRGVTSAPRPLRSASPAAPRLSLQERAAQRARQARRRSGPYSPEAEAQGRGNGGVPV